MPKTYSFRLVEKKCLTCGKRLVLKNNRDIERKKYCSYSCSVKDTLSKHPEMIRNFSLSSRTVEANAKRGATLSLKMKSGLIKKPPRKKRINPIKEPKPRRTVANSEEGGYQDRLCSGCAKEVKKLGKTRFCWDCYVDSRNIEYDCEFCGKRKKVLKIYYEKFNNHFCSMKCHYGWKKLQVSKAKINLRCENCGTSFYRFKSQVVSGVGKFCSVKCQGEWTSKNRSGENSPAYIDGRTPLIRLLRSSVKYEAWRKAVLIKDGNKCLKCGTNGYLHAHHIIHFSEMVGEFMKLNSKKDKTELFKDAIDCESLWNIKNGMALCSKCHAKEHPDINLTAGI